MAQPSDLHLAEVAYDTGEIRFRYARVMSADGTRWERHGLFREYHRNGQVIAEGQYVHGQEQGLWREYYPDGRLAAEGCYQAGQPVGEWRYGGPDDGPRDPTA